MGLVASPVAIREEARVVLQLAQSHQGPKEITRYQCHSAANSDCSSVCKQFIKNCYAYSGVKQTSTLFAGTHQHHEPATKLPALSGMSGLFPFKVGSANTGPVGPSNFGRLPTGANFHPYQARESHQIRCPPENMVQITTEVMELINKGAIVETQVTSQRFVSQIFLVEKKDGGQQPIKCLNHFVKAEHFKMEGLHLLPDQLQAQDWIVKLGLKDAYTSRSQITQTINIS